MPASKAQLRQQMRRQRQALDQSAQAAAAIAVCRQVARLPRWPRARRIALYIAGDGEIGTSALEALCRENGKQLFLPVITAGRSLEFAPWNVDSELVSNRFGIPEPAAENGRCCATELDIIFLPLVAWDARGGRLGMGGGFYDRALAGVSGPLRVGVAHAQQQVPRVPRDRWDVVMDFVLTDTALQDCRGRAR